MKKYLNQYIQPVFALPLDVFRIGIALLSMFYFVQMSREVALVSSLRGLINHPNAFSFLGLIFIPEKYLGDVFFYGLLWVGFLSSVLIFLGIFVRLFSFIASIIALSFCAWNYPLIHIEDNILQAMLVWLIFLPTGHTLNIREWLHYKEKAWKYWKHIKVPSSTIICFMLFVGCVYFMVGYSKFIQPGWRDGGILYSILLTEYSLVSHWIRPWMDPYFRIIAQGIIFLELGIAFFLILPRQWTFRKIGFFFQAILHILIISFMGYVISNLCLLLTSVIFYPRFFPFLNQNSDNQIQCSKVKYNKGWLILGCLFLSVQIVSQPFVTLEQRVSLIENKFIQFSRRTGLGFFYHVFTGGFNGRVYVVHDVGVKKKGADHFQKGTMREVWPDALRLVFFRKHLYLDKQIVLSSHISENLREKHGQVKEAVCVRLADVAEIRLTRKIYGVTSKRAVLEDSVKIDETHIICPD